MKRIFHLAVVFLFLVCYSAKAQPIITAAGCKPVIGDKFTMQYATNSTKNQPDSGGANCVWDYSQLVDASTKDEIFVYPTYKPKISVPGFPTLKPNSDGRANAVFFHRSTDSFYAYSKIDTNGISESERYGHDRFLPFYNWYAIRMTNGNVDKLTQQVFPFTYQQIRTDSCVADKVPLCTCTNYDHMDVHDTLIADGYGTLKLPNATYQNVLRVKKVQSCFMHVNISPIFVNAQYSTTTTYQFYTNGIHHPVLELISISYSSASSNTWNAAYLSSYSYDPLLPIAFNHFSANNVGNNILLSWDALSETNTSHFEVQHSRNGIDFMKIATIKAAEEKAWYKYVDDSKVVNPVNYYRIAAIGKNGSSNFSKVVTIHSGDNVSLTIHPNPVSDQFTMQLTHTKSEQALLQIINSAGQTVKHTTISLHSGTNQIKNTIGSLAKGSYTVTIETETNKWQQQIIKE